MRSWPGVLPPVLRERDLRLFVVGNTVAQTGSAMVPVALAFAVLGEGYRSADVGYVLGAETVPLVALLLAGGVIADRFPRRRGMVVADLLRMASEGVLAGLLLTGSPPLWVFLALAPVLGVGLALFQPASTGLLPEIAGATRLQDANAVVSTGRSLALLVGPAIAGVVVAVAGPGWAIAADAASFAVSAACLLGLRPRIVAAAADDASMRTQLVSGWHEFRSRTWLWVIVVQFSLLGMFALAPFLVLGPVIARERLGGPAAWGAVLAAEGAGAIVGGLLLLRWRPRRPLVTATLLVSTFALTVAALAGGVPLPLLIASSALSGVGLAVFGVLWDTTLQHAVPPELISRVSAYDWFGSTALLPLGYVLVGPLTGLLGARGALWLGAAVLVGSSAVVLAVPAVVTIRRADEVEVPRPLALLPPGG